MNKYIIKDWVGNVCLNGETFKSFDSASEKLDRLCDGLVIDEHPLLDMLSDEFGNLHDIERGEYVIEELQ